jgi:phenylalanyl-tRNA synthetase alpha chain
MSDTLLTEIAEAPDLTTVEALRVRLLGKSGEITALLKSLGKMSAEERSSEAPKIHALHEQVTNAITQRKEELETAELEKRLATERVDLSLPAPETRQGTVHPSAK